MIERFSYHIAEIRNLFGDRFRYTTFLEKPLESVSTSSLECRSGTLFVPLRGQRDGHNFISDALNRGASAFLCEKKHPILKDISKENREKAIFVEDTLLALGQLGEYHRRRFHPLVIGITGSSGKTTTKDLIGSLFEFLPGSELVVTQKNYNNEIGVPFTMFRINSKTRVVVCEMGMNHRGEIARLSKIVKPTIGLITTIGSAHIENLGSPKEIAEEKSDLTEGMQKGGILFVPEGIAFPKVVQKACKRNSISLEFWPTTESHEFELKKIKPKGFEFRFREKEFDWNLPGKSLLSNAIGALRIGYHLNIPPEILQGHLKKFKSPTNRLQIKKSRFLIIDDCYNANPESMLSSIESTFQLALKKTPLFVLGTMKELGNYSEFYHKKVGDALRKTEAHVYTFGKEAKFIGKSIPKSRTCDFGESDEEVKRLISKVKETWNSGTIILVKGSRSMKMERIVEGLNELQ